MPVCTLSQFPVVRAALSPHKDRLVESLWQVSQDEQRDPPNRFQAAAALAQYAPDDERWQAIAAFVAQHLTSAVSPVHWGHWLALFQPASHQLTDPLTVIHAERSRSEKQLETAAFALADYMRDQPGQLTNVILVADELAEFHLLIDALRPHPATVEQALLAEMQAAMPEQFDKLNKLLPAIDQQLRDARWKRQSMAAVVLVHLGFGDRVWSLLEFSPNPSLRSFVIHYLGKLGTDHNTLAGRLQIENEVTVRRA